VQQRLGELEAARSTQQRAARIFERFLGANHAYTREPREQLDAIGA
jgi:hypothetical protein